MSILTAHRVVTPGYRTIDVWGLENPVAVTSTGSGDILVWCLTAETPDAWGELDVYALGEGDYTPIDVDEGTATFLGTGTIDGDTVLVYTAVRREGV